MVHFALGTGLGTSGTFTIESSTRDAIGNLMFVFKGPATSGPTQSGLVAYQITPGTTSGNFATPFLEPPFSFPGAETSRDLSHISVYFTEDSVAVPAPAAAGLLALGLLAMGVGARRSRPL